MNSKAQVSFEFIIVCTALLTISLILFVVYHDSNLNLFQAQDSVVASRNVYSIAAAINYLYLAGDGASYSFKLSNSLDSENITISNYTVSSRRRHGFGSAPIITASVNDTSVESRIITITNNQGGIYLQ